MKQAQLSEALCYVETMRIRSGSKYIIEKKKPTGYSEPEGLEEGLEETLSKVTFGSLSLC